jgi:hypothetical protein
MGHDRKLVIGGASLTIARLNRHDIKVVPEIRDELERLMISTGYLDNAPFEWIGLMLRFGLNNEDEPHYEPINKKDGDLPVAIEVDTQETRDAPSEELKELYMVATLKTLVHVGKKYQLPHKRFEELLHDLQSRRQRRGTVSDPPR